MLEKCVSMHFFPTIIICCLLFLCFVYFFVLFYFLFFIFFFFFFFVCLFVCLVFLLLILFCVFLLLLLLLLFLLLLFFVVVSVVVVFGFFLFLYLLFFCLVIYKRKTWRIYKFGPYICSSDPKCLWTASRAYGLITSVAVQTVLDDSVRVCETNCSFAIRTSCLNKCTLFVPHPAVKDALVGSKMYENICFRYLLESPHWGDSNKYPKHMLLEILMQCSCIILY